jgi:hypothetical protein
MPTHGLFWDGLLQVLVHFATPSPLPTWRFRYTALQSDAGSGVKGGAMSESKRGARAKVGRLAERVRKVLDEGADAAQEIHKKVINLPLALPIPAEVEGIGRNESASGFLRSALGRKAGDRSARGIRPRLGHRMRGRKVSSPALPAAENAACLAFFLLG